MYVTIKALHFWLWVFSFQPISSSLGVGFFVLGQIFAFCLVSGFSFCLVQSVVDSFLLWFSRRLSSIPWFDLATVFCSKFR